ncbi:hypothetical protein OIU77_012647 [Salix suchowensis]|uniref:Uncharacterized protein n=1 Tax=Salix suchowensis TaxID=1278906 RepID=A0ABQ9A547_9ROSI|nr:hypothetical protein OIU77_012647 [Salix suchowensis]
MLEASLTLSMQEPIRTQSLYKQASKMHASICKKQFFYFGCVTVQRWELSFTGMLIGCKYCFGAFN